MGQPHESIPFSELTCAANYDIDSLESEIKADRYCAQLLKFFHRWLIKERQQEPLAAGQLAAGADYFLREFLIGARRQNIFQVLPEHLSKFGGNWYIISNLEPNLAELKPMLTGTSLFYAYCVANGLFEAGVAGEIDEVARQDAFFENRITAFHQLEDDGYRGWDQACPLK